MSQQGRVRKQRTVSPEKATPARLVRLLKSRRLWLTAAALIAVACLWGWVAGSDAAMAVIQRTFAQTTSLVLNVFGSGTVAEGNVVFSEDFGITVVTACTGIFATGLFLLAVVAFPATWISKLIGVSIGIAGLFVINVIRLASLYVVGIHWPSILDPVHQLVWQSLLIVLAIALWLLWASRASAIRGGGRS